MTTAADSLKAPSNFIVVYNGLAAGIFAHRSEAERYAKLMASATRKAHSVMTEEAYKSLYFKTDSDPCEACGAQANWINPCECDSKSA